MKKVELFTLPRIPLVKEGDDIGSLILEASEGCGLTILENDIVVIAHKIVSKAEGRIVNLSQVTPSKEASQLAKRTGRDPRHCEVIIRESKRILYTNDRAIITEQKLGFVNTSSGVDRSNSESKEGEIAVLLPEDPDGSAGKIREKLMSVLKVEVAVIINDSMGRPWRKGSVGMAIGLAGISATHKSEKQDLAGRTIRPEIALVDEISASASMLMGQADERVPVVVLRGVDYVVDSNPRIQDLLRPYEEDQIWE